MSDRERQIEQLRVIFEDITGWNKSEAAVSLTKAFATAMYNRGVRVDAKTVPTPLEQLIHPSAWAYQGDRPWPRNLCRVCGLESMMGNHKVCNDSYNAAVGRG